MDNDVCRPRLSFAAARELDKFEIKSKWLKLINLPARVKIVGFAASKLEASSESRNIPSSPVSRLVSARINDISDEEFRAVGSVVWNTMFKVKERLDVHRRIIACEAPPMVHAGTCTKQKLCEDDWKQLWWNGMGRFLLDGRNPQPYKDAVERFEKLDIGQINLDCWKAVLYIVKAHSAFDHERKLITRTADDLVKYLIVKPNFEDFGRLVH
jgi:hypothetical protein